MSGTGTMHPTTAAGLAKNYLDQSGLVPKPELVDQLAAALVEGVRYDQTGIYLVDHAGNRMSTVGPDGQAADLPIGNYLGTLANGAERQSTTSQARSTNAAQRPAPGDPYGGRDDTFARLGRGLAAQRAAEDERRARDVAAQGNPWLPGRTNRTAQAIITKSNPELAARWKAEAGVHEAKYSWK